MGDHLSCSDVAAGLMRATKLALAPKRVYHVSASPRDEPRSSGIAGTPRSFSRFILRSRMTLSEHSESNGFTLRLCSNNVLAPLRIILLRKISIVSVALSLKFVRISEVDIQPLSYQLLWSPLATLLVNVPCGTPGVRTFLPSIELGQRPRSSQGDHPVSQRRKRYSARLVLSTKAL